MVIILAMVTILDMVALSDHCFLGRRFYHTKSGRVKLFLIDFRYRVDSYLQS